VMEVLNFERRKLTDFKSHVWVEDVLYFDGPILALLKGDTKLDYFYYWCDSDDQYNRWLAIPVNRTEIEKYKSGQLSILDLAADPDVELTLVDVNSELLPRKAWAAVFDQLPEDYVPPETSYFDAELSPSWGGELLEIPAEFDLSIDGNWYLQDLFQVPKLFTQLYSFMYTLQYLGKPAVQENAQRIFTTYPWRGGFSSVNFYRDLNAVIPSLHEPKVNSINYASPGKIELELLTGVSASLTRLIKGISENDETIRDVIGRANSFLRGHNLSRLEGVETAEQFERMLTRDTRRALRGYLDELTSAMGMDEYREPVQELSQSDLVAIKMFKSFYNRVEKLARFHRSGLLKL